MHSKRHYKIFIWSVIILGQLESFRTYKGSRVLFSRNLRRSLKYYERKTFSDSSIRHIFSSENFRFPFSTKNNLTLGVKFERLILGIFFRIVLEWNGHIEIFSLLPAIKNSSQFLLLGKNILQKTVNGCLQGSLDQSLTDRCKHF